MEAERTILHCDMNNFYASVESVGHPEYRLRPMAVCGDPEKRHGIILAKNDLAKRYGIKTGEKIADARAKCPGILLLPPHYEKYAAYSAAARELYGAYTDLVENFGPDECWLDVTGSTMLMGSGKKIADELREKVKHELGLTISAGVSYNKIFAKMGSDYKKPDATTVITRENYRALLWPLPVSDLLFVGPSTTKRLELYGVRNIGDLANIDTDLLCAHFGKVGVQLQETARGKDSAPVAKIDTVQTPQSISNGITAVRDLVCEEDAAVVLSVLCDNVATKLRKWNRKCGHLTVNFRTKDLRQFHRGTELRRTCLSSAIFRAAMDIYRQTVPNGMILRSITVSAEKLEPIVSEQFSFLDNSREIARKEDFAYAVDRIRENHGYKILRPAVSLLSPELSDFYPTEDSRFKVFRDFGR